MASSYPTCIMYMQIHTIHIQIALRTDTITPALSRQSIPAENTQRTFWKSSWTCKESKRCTWPRFPARGRQAFPKEEGSLLRWRLFPHHATGKRGNTNGMNWGLPESRSFLVVDRTQFLFGARGLWAWRCVFRC